jgi:mycothiol synthase
LKLFSITLEYGGMTMRFRKAMGLLCRTLVRWQERNAIEDSVTMWRSLDDLPTLPQIPGVDVVTMNQHDRDEDLIDIYNEACVGSPNFRRAGRTQIEAFKASPLHDPEGVFIARIEGEAAGYCFARVLPDGSGKITGLAVLSGYQKRGIGRLLLLCGLYHLKTRGADRVHLLADCVDRIQALYESLGFLRQEPTVTLGCSLEASYQSVP